MKREVSEYDPKLEQDALNYVVDNFDAIGNRIRELKKIAPKKKLQTVGNEVLQAYAEGSKVVDDERKSLATSIYIKDGHTADGQTVDFVNLILDGTKKGETRSHKSLTRKWVGIAKDGYVYGRVRFGEPYLISKDSPEYADSYIEGTEYDIEDGEQKYYYPVLEVEDFRDDPKPITKHGNYAQYEDVEDVRYSISEIVDENNNSYGMGVKLDSTLLDNLTPDERIEMVKERVKELGGSTFTAYDNNGNAVDVTIAKSSRTFKNKNGRRVSVNKDLTTKYNKNETKQEAVVLVDELIETAHYLNSDPAKHPHDWLDNNGKNDWERWTTYIEDKNNTIWEATLNVANATNGEKILYDISPIKKVGRSGKSDAVPTDKIVPQNLKNVNTSDEDFRKSLATSESRIARLKEDKEFLKQQMEKSRSVALSPADVDKIVKDMRDQFGFDNSERDNVKKMLELILISILVFFCTI